MLFDCVIDAQLGDALLSQFGEHGVAKLAMQKELLLLVSLARGLLAWDRQELTLLLHVLLGELLGVVDAGLVVRGGENVPRF